MEYGKGGNMNEKGLEKEIEDFVLSRGAVSVGISTRQTLENSPPSADITYIMENGLSAITFSLPMDTEHIHTFLGKEDRSGHARDDIILNTQARTLSKELASMIAKQGHQAIRTAPNLKYRTEVRNWRLFLPPDISHRYLAVTSGAGSFGWSGNVGVEGYGTALVYGTTITTAKLEPTKPIPQEDNFCSNCKACVRSCPLDMFSLDDEMAVTLGGIEYTYAARINLARCLMCCGGNTGLHRSKKWSSWSPGRFEIPDDDEGVMAAQVRVGMAADKRPQMEGGVPFRDFIPAEVLDRNPDRSVGDRKAILTCGNCTLVCTGDEKENLANLRTPRKSGCVIQYPDGSTKVLPGDEAEAEFAEMPPDHQALYC